MRHRILNNIPKVHISACKKLIYDCARLSKNETVLIIYDLTTVYIADIIFQLLQSKEIHVSKIKTKLLKMHGEEPATDISKRMLDSDVIFCLSKMSMAHSKARLAASLKGSRFLSLPYYSLTVLESKAMFVDYMEAKIITDKVASILTDSNKLRITSKSGTDITCDVNNRIANSAPGVCYEPGSIASPPDIEANIAPIENNSNGVIVVDGSILCDEFGLLGKDIIRLYVDKGIVQRIDGKNSKLLDSIFSKLDTPKTRVIGEVGIGLNNMAELKGEMLEDEGCLGTVHFGIGSNSTIGGLNEVPFHLDHVVKNVTLETDKNVILKEGVLCV